MPGASRRRRATALGLLAVGALAAGLAFLAVTARDTRGATVERFRLHSRLVHRTLTETTVTPRGAGPGRPLLVFLHGRGGGPDSNLSDELFAGLDALGPSAPVVVLADGGDHSYWHDRDGGRWGSMIVRELIPAAVRQLDADPRRVAIGGVSMGGFGAFDIAGAHPRRFCAVGGHSAALWLRAGDSAPGAFDDAADFARHDVVAAARRHPGRYGSTPLWLDVGRRDPFRAADTAFAAILRRAGARLTFRVWPGAHGGAYWRAHMRGYLRFYARALARCRRA